MSIDIPFEVNQRVWSHSIDRQWDIFLLQMVENDTPAARRAQHPDAYIPYGWSIEHTVLHVRRPQRAMRLRRRLAIPYASGSHTTPAGSP